MKYVKRVNGRKTSAVKAVSASGTALSSDILKQSAVGIKKYRNTVIRTEDGKFDSKLEFARWRDLKIMEKAGLIKDLERQVPFTIIPSQRDENGKVIEREAKYVADFVYTENGKTVVEDVKSKATKTKEYIIKRKLMLKEYGIRIKEV